MSDRIIGIDLAVTAQHKAIVLDPARDEFIGRPISFRAYPAEMDKLLLRARQGADEEVNLVAILEATGMAWYPVATYLEGQGVQVFRVNGQKTKDFRQVLWKHTGSDQIDCRVLAKLYQVARPRLSRCPLPSGELLALQRACRIHAQWQVADTAVQNRMTALDSWAWQGLHKLIPPEAKSWMRTDWYDAWHVLEQGADGLREAWLEACGSPDTDSSWIAGWVERAQQMTELYGSPNMAGYPALQETMRSFLEERQRYKQQMNLLFKEQINPLYTRLFPDCHLTSIRGIAPQSAAFYHSFIQDIDRFPSVEQFRKWCGIVPRSHQSGEAESKGLPLTKAGPNLVKATLYLNAEVARQWDVQFAFIYQQQMVRYGKHHLQAVCACASHLANRIYALLKQNRPYELRDLQGKPISAAQSRELCLLYHVPDEVRERNNKRSRRQRAEQRAEGRLPKRSGG
jgi:transposase